ncbi:hypothetical protein EP1X_03105 [Thermococcus sp. EP1]|uniref:hypothetical protein n=1 Tax=Thermococcus sp. EP1 TaxID=1591054 RepID=UPI0006D98519|nr:hypothetical protein [Thermococcus sp. EP1]KPU63344.1 hypothetical protein EP1X_03105 [Thermococcus sp. EP1]
MECYFIHDLVDLIFGVLLLMWYYHNKEVGKNIKTALVAGLIFILTSLFYGFLSEYIIAVLELSASVLFFILFARFFKETLGDGNTIKRVIGVLVIALLVLIFANIMGVYRSYIVVQAIFLTWIGFKLFINFERIRIGDRSILSLMIVFSALSGVSRILNLLVLSDFLYFSAVLFLLLSISEMMYISLPRTSNFFRH